MQKSYLLSDVEFGEQEAEAVAQVVRDKWLSLGPRTAQFEDEFAAKLNARHAVALSSCTAALHLALQALDIGPGDEVLVPSYTFVATTNAILYQNATPVFVDINGEHDLNLDGDDLIAKITPRTKAIMVVHLAGFPCDMDRIMAVAEQHGAAVVEDACHAIGAAYEGACESSLRGHKAGTIGHVGCFSFFANKNLVTGEGGMLVTNDAELARRAKLGRSHGMNKSSWDKASGRAFDYDIEQLGFNYRCTEITAALGKIQLEKLDKANSSRKAAVHQYRQRLKDCEGLTLPFSDRLDDSAHHIFPILLDDARKRQPLRQLLSDQGIQTSVHYPPVHLFSHYRDRFPGCDSLPRTEEVSARELTLPLHPLLNQNDVDYICHAVQKSLHSLSTSRKSAHPENSRLQHPPTEKSESGEHHEASKG